MLLLSAWCCSATAWGQLRRVQFPTAEENASGLAQAPTTQPAPPQTLPSNDFVQVQPAPPRTVPGSAPPGATIQPPTFLDPFDPFATQPTTTPTPATQPGFGSSFSTQPVYPPTNPSSTFPGGLSWSPNWKPSQYLKVLNDLRVRYTWIAGDTGRELDINDLEIAFTLNLPNFLHSGQPIHVSPGFAFHWWQGPSAPFSPPSELPSRAYSTYLEFDWRTNPNNRFGVEADAFLGLYTDFKNTTASLRIHGTGLGWWRLTNNFAFKGGIAYLDRVDLKMLPAVGVFWQPNELWNLELYFPSPRLERDFGMIQNTHVWAYLGGEYGGGSWSIQHNDGRVQPNDQIDINDIRLFTGIKWYRDPNAGIRGFAEIGWVFDREIIFRFNPGENLKLEDSIMLRGGLTF